MSSKYIDNSAYTTSGYTLAANYQSVTIGTLGTIGGPGLVTGAGAAVTVANYGSVAGSSIGMYLEGGGIVTNSGANALIEGATAIEMKLNTSTVANTGTIDGTSAGGTGIVLYAGGVVTNTGSAALIEGGVPILIANAPGTVGNSGTIFGSYSTKQVLYFGIYLKDGGAVTNTGLIEGGAGVVVEGAAGTIDNAGSIEAIGTLYYGVVLVVGGSVTNGVSGFIKGYVGVHVAESFSGVASTVSNYGTIMGASSGPGGVYLYQGGEVTNSGGAAIIEGGKGVVIGGAAGTVGNAGTISGVLGVGASLRYGGNVTNSVGGLIEGLSGVSTTGDLGTVDNFGTIRGTTGAGIFLADGGIVTNGVHGLIEGVSVGVNMSGADETVINAGTIVATGTASQGVYSLNGIVTNSGTASLIEGGTGILISDGAGTIGNAGTIIGTYASGSGVYLKAGGVVANGGAAALIEGEDGVLIVNDAGSITNAGTIQGNRVSGAGISLRGGGIIHNAVGGLVEGYDGIDVSSVAATITNGGRIDGGTDGGAGIYLTVASVVTNNAGGVIQGQEGVFDRVGGVIKNAGTIDGIGDAGIFGFGSSITNSAVISVIEGAVGVELYRGGTLNNFGTIASTAGADGVAVRFQSPKETLIDEGGSTFIGQVIGDGGTLQLAGAAGTLNGLGVDFSGFSFVNVQVTAEWTFAGTAILAAGTISRLNDNGLLTLTGTSSASGTIEGEGTLTLAGSERFGAETELTVAHVRLTAGTLALGANLAYAGGFVETGGAVAFGGETLSLTKAATFAGGTIAGSGFLATYGGASLTKLAVNGGAIWQVYGQTMATGALTLGNAGGGSGRLTIERGGIFDIAGNVGITVAAGGTGNIINRALFEKTGGAGISSIAATISNTGTIAVTIGTLNLQGAVTGTGEATIGTAGTLKFDGAVAAGQTVSFAGTIGSGDLVLNDPSGTGLGFAGTVSGFGGADKLDLATFSFSGGPKLAWTQNGTKGILTVTDGSKVARITLFGQYSLAGFHKATDGASGTVITYTPPPQIALAPPHR